MVCETYRTVKRLVLPKIIDSSVENSTEESCFSLSDNNLRNITLSTYKLETPYKRITVSLRDNVKTKTLLKVVSLDSLSSIRTLPEKYNLLIL